MTSEEIYAKIQEFLGEGTTIICNLHSACYDKNNKTSHYICSRPGSAYPVIDFDAVKEKYDAGSAKPRKSADALVLSPKQKICFVELKSWHLFLKYYGTVKDAKKQAKKYEEVLPLKLNDSISICEDICKKGNVFSTQRITYVLITDIPIPEMMIEDPAAYDLFFNIIALGSTATEDFCNYQTLQALSKISGVDTYYWDCHQFETKIKSI